MGCGKQREATAPIKCLVKLQPEFEMEDLPLDRIAALVPEFALTDLPLVRTLMTKMCAKNEHCK